MNENTQNVFFIHARPVEMVVVVNKTVKAFPRTKELIGNQSLLVKTSSQDLPEKVSHPIVYTLVKPHPRSGRIVTVIGKRLLDISSFTQDDINQGKVFYEPTTDLRGWEESDTLYFEISTMYAKKMRYASLNITISYSNIHKDNYKDILQIRVPIVQEGNKFTITPEYFDASNFLKTLARYNEGIEVTFTFAEYVHHGALWFKDMDAEISGIFSQEDLNEGSLVYSHDHSDSEIDWFTFQIQIFVPQTIDEAYQSIRKNFNFTIEIYPINDSPFRFLTLYPQVTVLQGSNVTLSEKNLNTIDLDTGPEGLVYNIVTPPDNGVFEKKSDSGVTLSSFTQKDINEGEIIFQHDGSRKATSTLEFEISDMKFKPILGKMEIYTTPLEIKIASNREIPLLQGSRSVTLSNRYLGVSSNGNLNTLKYVITQATQFGSLKLAGYTTQDFTQSDLESGELEYVLYADSPGYDFFVCNIYMIDKDCRKDAQQFNITIKPLITSKPILASPGTSIVISRQNMDVSRLARLTNDDPQFHILTAPSYGNIMKRANRQKRSVPGDDYFVAVSDFTFEDVVLSKVHYFADKESTASVDRFTYKLSANGVPPAEGEYIIQLANGGTDSSRNDKNGVSVTEQDSTDSSDDNTKKVEEIDMDDAKDGTDNSTVIGIIVAFLLFLIIIIILLVFYMKRRRHKCFGSSDYDNQYKPRPYISGPMQLDQPHVIIEPKQEEELSLTHMSGEDASLVEGFENMYINTPRVNRDKTSASINTSLSADVIQVSDTNIFGTI